MNWNWLNPNWLLSRLLEMLGVGNYTARVELAAHVCAGFAFSWVFGWWGLAFWSVYSLVDEFLFDGYKVRDTWIDLASKLAGPVAFVVWRAW